MTIPSTARKAGPLLGTGVQTTWPFTFKVFAPTDIAVTTAILGVETQLVYGSDYSVALNPNQETSPGGTVTYPISGTPLPTGGKLTIIGNLPYDQPLDLPSGGNFSPLALENQLDRTTMQIQQLGEQVGRALRLPVTATGASTVLPVPESNNLIGWNGDETALTNVPATDLVAIAAFGTTQADIFTGTGSQTTFTLTGNPGAQANLDVSISGVTQLPGVDYVWTSGTTLTFTSAPANGVKILARYGQVLPAGGGTEAPTTADLVTYDPLAVAPPTSVAAELRTAQSQAEHFWRAVRNNQRDVYLIVTGDSTGNEDTEWVRLMANWLAAECPTHTIKYRLFNDGTTSWGSYTTLQTGTGPALPFTGTPFTIHIDNGSVSGTNTFYTQGARESAFWSGIDYDLAIVNYGHNLGTAMTEVIALPEWVIALSHVRLMAPRAGLLVTLQNPRSSSTSDINTNGSAQSARMVAAWRKAVELVGAGVIDVYTAFRTHPDYASLMADETHPSALGSQVWVKEVKRVLAEPNRLTGDAPLGYNPLAEVRPNFAPNPRLVDWSSTNPTGWTFTNCTPSKDTGRTDGTLYTAKITVGAGVSPQITADVSAALSHLSGKTVTMVARVWRPSNLGLLGGRVEIASTDSVTSSASFVSYPRGAPSSGGWEWVQATLTIPRIHNLLTLRIYAGAADGSDSGKAWWLAGVWFGEGVLPAALDTSNVSSKSVLDFYNDGNVGLVPTTTTGSVTASSGTITLTGATSPNAGVYINLPGLTPGKTYRVTFNPVSCTGNTAGGVYARNGYGGGFTDLAKASGTGDWSVGGGVVAFTFVAPSNPVSLWAYGYTGATGWVLNQWAIALVESGIVVPVNLRVTDARNTSGTILTATASASTFGISVTAGTGFFLATNSVLNAISSPVCIYDVVLPNEYVAGRNLTLTINVNHTGTGTPGTRTIDVEAWRTGADGTQGGDICATAVQNFTGTATNYTFTLTGTTLNPGDRLLIRVSMVLQETAGANNLLGRVNSVRIS